MKNVLKKLAKAKAELADIEVKKNGKNSFSNYDYFTPSYVSSLVDKVSKDNGLLTMFDLVRDELGEKGILHIYDIESGECFDVIMATAIPEIKATNIAQQLGGCATYTERYLKMTAFGIIDNRLDFDTTENTKAQKTEEKNPIVPPKDVKPTLEFNTESYIKVVAALKSKNYTIEQVEQKYTLTPQIKARLKTDTK